MRQDQVIGHTAGPSAGQASRGEVLIVEDTAASLKLLSDLLTGAGYYVRQAPNGELALWTAQSRPPELILLDVRMPGMDGYEVCRRLKAMPGLLDVPVIFLSAQHDTDDKLRGFALGGVDFIAKPFQAEEILARTDAQVRLRRAQQALAAERAHLEERVMQRTAELAAVAMSLEAEVGLRRANEDALRLAGQVFAATRDAIVITDAAGNMVAVNPAFTRITGYTADEAMGQPVTMLRTAQGGNAYGSMVQAINASGHWSGEMTAHRKGGGMYTGLLSVSTVQSADGAIENFIVAFIDMTERKAEQHLIDFLSYHDALTGLPNRTQARSRFDELLAACGPDQCVAVLCLDLDRFKSINDSYGAAIGDEALKTVARFLRSCVREGDMVSRHGGDEFLVMVADDLQCSVTTAMAETILNGLRRDFPVEGHAVALTTSIGIATAPADGATLDELVQHAEMALFRAKDLGRDGYAFYTEGMDADVRRRLALQSQLRGAVARGEFSVHYQPQVCLRTGRMTGAEALLRWHNVVLGQVPPGQFIPVAEEYGLINSIGVWVLDTVCQQIRAWQDQGLGDVRVAVNLSGSQFGHADTVPLVEETLARHGVPPSCLGIEITEGCVMGDPDKSVGALRRLKAIGVGISLDDFGTGYSSLAYLKRFPIDVLKIDKSFVDDVAHAASDAAIALSVISLAHNLNMRVVAEGVETPEQARFLASHGCDAMQGYLYSRPLTAADFTSLLRHPRSLDLDQE
ncbi:EAL domain-containing protein [Duganella sp. FT92W]|uniref:EAL domain-containing protein n=1 Tax=Pseudoduganella rivuli TaxID=2666085 RepID=A0A7X2II06_9BURK|nr:GGDEF domain-containing response regulator [Pseudoduganella rivuli]MRV70150.1 EAL domain-containing protein [Pseudoduganella rivuli]